MMTATLEQVACSTYTTRFLSKTGRKLKMVLRIDGECPEMREAHTALIRALGDENFVRRYLEGVRLSRRGSIESNGLVIGWKRPKGTPGLLNLTVAEMS